MKSVEGVDIIGGESGPVSVFIAGKGNSHKMGLKTRIKNAEFQLRRKFAEIKIQPGTHTKEETIAYVKEKYGFYELNSSQRRYIEVKNNMKEAIVSKYQPELLGEYEQIPFPATADKDSLNEFYKKLQERNKQLQSVSEEQLPMDFQMYELQVGNGYVHLELELRWDFFSVSFSGDRKSRKRRKQIAKDLYCYYGVAREDIENRTERYMALVCALSEL